MDWFVMTWVVVGLIAGGLAWLVVPGRSPMRMWLMIFLGLIGAYLGSLLLWTVGGVTPGGTWDVVGEATGAVLLLGLAVATLRSRFSAERGRHRR